MVASAGMVRASTTPGGRARGLCDDEDGLEVTRTSKSSLTTSGGDEEPPEDEEEGPSDEST